MTQVQERMLTERQNETLQRLAFKQVMARELNLKMKDTNIEKDLSRKEREDIKGIRKDIESWEIYRNRKKLITETVRSSRKRFLLLRIVKAYEVDCSQCIFIGNCERADRNPVFCFEYRDAMGNNDFFNQLGHDKKRIAIFEQMLKETFR